ncbi:MAG: hypothetical protein JJ903_12295 [Spongiibacter sp.]|uniref:hypothetical protein n=1 Tax=Spongiibacter TaxID=630749 RepID=UPI001B0CCDC2|nr:hypothetical protein [Spongiibacter sp.]MBO6753843.1 hypothetical protein [Spongiibacter sp.]
MEMAVATMNATFRIIGMLAFTLIISGMPVVAQLSGGRSGVANAVLIQHRPDRLRCQQGDEYVDDTYAAFHVQMKLL